jgi:hypothetical protein
MLKSYSPNQPIDETTLSLIGGIVAAYKRNSKIISKLCRTESDSTVEDSAKVVYERLKILREYSKGIIFAHCNDNIRFAFECLVELMRQGKCTEDNIWDIMDDSIFEALPKNRK